MFFQESEYETYQYVKRFFMIDTITGLNSNIKEDPVRQYSANMWRMQYNFIRCIKSIAIDLNINNAGDRISLPKFTIQYADIYFNDSKFNDYVDFQFSITFHKHYSFNGTFEIILPIFILLSFINAIVCSMSYKLRQNKMEYDFEIFVYFTIQLCSNVATSLFIIAIILSLIIFFIYKTQSVVTIMIPVHEHRMIEIFVAIAFSLKFLKIIEIVYCISNIDIFFIDWERPKLFDNHNHYGFTRNTLDTPSMCSSAVRKYFIIYMSTYSYFIRSNYI